MIMGYGGMYEEEYSFETVVVGKDNAESLFSSHLPRSGDDFNEWEDLHSLYMYKAMVNEHGIIVPVPRINPIHAFER